MHIAFQTTTQLTATEWESYTAAFNLAFDKEYDVGYFQHKYLHTIDGHSYHAFLKEGDQIVGGCTVIPYEYFFEEKITRCGLAVDVFIASAFRSDPLALYRMYSILKKELILKDISLVIAVPNDMVYAYWKNVVKWKDIGFLNYHVLPLKSEKIRPKLPAFFNTLSYTFAQLMVLLSRLLNTKEKQSKIYINRSHKIIEEQRYTEEHIRLKTDHTYASYRIVNEEGVKTCYLIDFYNIHKGCKDGASLRQAIQRIMTTETVDIIVFIGKLNFLQLLLLKVPFRYEPRHLKLMADLLIPENLDTKLLFSIKNWDFGLFNYDVR